VQQLKPQLLCNQLHRQALACRPRLETANAAVD